MGNTAKGDCTSLTQPLKIHENLRIIKSEENNTTYYSAQINNQVYYHIDLKDSLTVNQVDYLLFTMTKGLYRNASFMQPLPFYLQQEVFRTVKSIKYHLEKSGMESDMYNYFIKQL